MTQHGQHGFDTTCPLRIVELGNHLAATERRRNLIGLSTYCLVISVSCNRITPRPQATLCLVSSPTLNRDKTCMLMRHSTLPSIFSVLTLLVGHWEEHPACRNWVMRCWRGCLSGARCRLFAYGPADATATQNPIGPHISCFIWIQTGFTARC